MIRKSSLKLLLDFMYHKSVRRVLRKCATVVKMAAFILCLMMLSGFLHASFEQSVLEPQSREKSKFLLRHQRQLADERSIKAEVAAPAPQTLRKPNDVKVTSQLSKDTWSSESEDEFVPKPVALGNVPLYMAVDYNVFKTKAFEDREREIQLDWSKRIEAKQFSKTPPNPNFVFHNKLPKSGSSTMNNILKALSKDNKFKFLKMETSDFLTSDDSYLINALESKVTPPFLLLKHHRFLNFTKSHRDQPTYINVMRDPLEWFTSRYYFSRFGWNRKPGCRKADCGMSEAERKMEIDDCVKKRHRECMSPWMYIQFFCGTSPECNNVTSLAQKEKATEIAKKNILDEYHVMGILEHFEDTLRLFEHLLPDYFRNAVPTWKSDFVQKKQQLTKTTYKKEMSEESKEFFRNGPLHYEIELYNFALELFKQKLNHFDLKATV